MVAIVLVGAAVYDVWQERIPELDSANIAGPARGADQQASWKVRTTSAISTRTIVARNLFDPERGAKSAEAAAPEKLPDEPQQSIDGILLLGTVIAGSERYAIMKVPPDLGPAPNSRRKGVQPPAKRVATGSGGAEVRRIRVGDSLRGYRVKDIEEQKVVLIRGDAKAEVTLDYTREVVVPPKAKSRVQKANRKARTRKSRSRRARTRREP